MNSFNQKVLMLCFVVDLLIYTFSVVCAVVVMASMKELVDRDCGGADEVDLSRNTRSCSQTG